MVFLKWKLVVTQILFFLTVKKERRIVEKVFKHLLFPSLLSPFSSPFQTRRGRFGGTIWFAGCWVPWAWSASWWLTSTTAWMWSWLISSPPDSSGGTTPWPTYRSEPKAAPSHCNSVREEFTWSSIHFFFSEGGWFKLMIKKKPPTLVILFDDCLSSFNYGPL